MGAGPVETPIWLIAGPTGSGKSALALRLAEAVGGEIVNADSMQLYRDLSVLTARPTPADEARVPHHLYGVADAADSWSAGRWLTAAREALALIAERGAPAIVAGGTGLYLHALTEGLADIPPVGALTAAAAEAAFDEQGEAMFRRRLAQGDPRAAARIMPGDRQRLVRAWAVFTATGRALSDWQARTAPAPTAAGWRGVVLTPPRAELYRRCDERLASMARAGALGEVAALLARGLAPGLPAMKALGVSAFADQLAGRLSPAEALARAQRETRHYVKRQLTWLRHRMTPWPRVEAGDPDTQWRQFLALT